MFKLSVKDAFLKEDKTMTLSDVEKIPKEILTVADVAPYLSVDPNTLRWQAQNEPEKLGFPVIVSKSRVKIPKDAFVFFCRYGRPVIVEGGQPELPGVY